MRKGLRRSLTLTVLTIGAFAFAASAHGAPTPGVGASDQDWRAWAQAEWAETTGTDWAAAAAAQGCVLVDVAVTAVVDATLNAELGAPADLSLPVVEQTTDCTGPRPWSVGLGGVRPDAVAASNCVGISGGTTCVGRSGAYVTASHRAAAATNGFVRLYWVASLPGCPTGSTLATSSDAPLAAGQTRSVRAYAGSGSYSSHWWRKALVGHTDTGGACAAL